MNVRRITALTALVSFLLEVLTSVVLYIVPQGRIAYWADWRLWGMTKEEWTAQHINLGVLFVIAIGMHMYYNWTPITNYLKNKAKQLKIFTKEFNAALLLILIFCIGTYADIVPFSTIIDVSDSIKDDLAVKYGEPPYGHAELSSIKTFASKMEVDLPTALQRLQEAGYPPKDEMQTLKELGEEYGISPQQVYLTIKPEAGTSAVRSGEVVEIPDSPPPGTGNLTLADFCSKYNLQMKSVLHGLEAKGITAREAQTIKEIAAENNTSPVDIFQMIKEMVQDAQAG